MLWCKFSEESDEFHFVSEVGLLLFWKPRISPQRHPEPGGLGVTQRQAAGRNGLGTIADWNKPERTRHQECDYNDFLHEKRIII